MNVCQRCGVENTADSNFCRRCGERLNGPDELDSTGGFTLDRGFPRDAFEVEAPAQGGTEGTLLQIVSDGGREGELIAVEGRVTTIGRTPESDLFLDDITVSRHHAKIVAESGAYFVEDLASLNGTYVNRKRIERHRLFDGDELQVGKFKLAFLQPKTDE